MAMTVDEQVWEQKAPATLGDALELLQKQVSKSGKVIIKVQLDGQELQGDALEKARAVAITDRTVSFSTDSQTELAKRMIGRLAALVEYLGGQQRHIAGLIEKGDRSKALEQLSAVLSAWQQIQHSFGSLLQLIHTGLEELKVGEISAPEVLADFRRQLTEIADALKNQDLVLVADILQYEMDSAIANWTGLLAAALGVVEKLDTVKR